MSETFDRFQEYACAMVYEKFLLDIGAGNNFAMLASKNESSGVWSCRILGNPSQRHRFLVIDHDYQTGEYEPRDAVEIDVTGTGEQMWLAVKAAIEMVESQIAKMGVDAS